MMKSRLSAADLTVRQPLARLVGERRIENQLRHPEDRVHGRADFMAHVGQERILGAIAGFGLFFRAAKLFFELLAIRDVDARANQANGATLRDPSRPRHGSVASAASRPCE